MKIVGLRAGLLSLLIILAGHDGAAASGAAMFKNGPAQSGVYAVAPPHSVTGIAFTFQAGGPIRGTPTLSDETLYFGSEDGRFYALDAKNGHERWRLDVGAPITSTPAVAAGTAYFTARDLRLHAVTSTTGKPVWSLSFGPDLGDKNYWDFYTSSPILADGRLFVGGGDGRMYALNPRNGGVLWSYDAKTRIRSTPAIAQGVVVFGGQNGYVYGLDAATGRALWRYATVGASRTFAFKHNDTTSVYTSPSIADGVVTLGARDGNIYGLDLLTGKQLWQKTHDGGSWILSTAIADGRVYVGSGSAFLLQAADLHTGEEKWRFKTRAAVFGSPSIAGDVIIIDDIEGNLYGIDRQDGRQLWRLPLGDRSFATPVIGNGVIYAAADNGIVYGIATSTERRSRPLPRKLVYFEGQGFSWFTQGVDQAILNYFVSAGYEQVDAAGLQKAMEEQIEKGGRSVVIFADDKVPVAVDDSDDDHALIRQYLDNGGRVVFVGNNPLAFVRDKKTGDLQKIDIKIAERVLGLSYPPPDTGIGYQASAATAEGRRWGLRDVSAASSSMRPQDVTTVLARDEFGMATSWTKDYPKGGMLIQVALPRTRTVDLQPYLLVAEHGL